MSDEHNIFVFDPTTLLGSIYALRSTGSDSHYGCPAGYHGGSIRCAANKLYLPNEVEGKISKEEFMALTNEIDNIFNYYHWPTFPCTFTCCDVCVTLHCKSERVRHILKALDHANESIAERGYYWEMIGGNGMLHGYIAVLKVNDDAHAKYLATHPEIADSSVNVSAVVAVKYVEATAEMVMVRGDDV